MKLTIETAINGYILTDGVVGERSVYVTDRPTLAERASAVRSMLYEILEMLGENGSRYDSARVRIVIEPGDKWISPEEAEPIRTNTYTPSGDALTDVLFKPFPK